MDLKDEIIDLLNIHLKSFKEAEKFSHKTDHATPSDTKNWSQILASLISNTKGLKRQKGADLEDGSDVKGANVWGAIDTPRFNGVVKAGRILTNSDNTSDIYEKIYFVMWDYKILKATKTERCRVWCVRASNDKLFKEVANNWYKLRSQGKIKSSNFQLHPPRNKDNNIFKNNCGNLSYPLVLSAEYNKGTYQISHFDLDILKNGVCIKAN
jgi:hypothetical protein